jgi:SH3-like domain-containing protein
MSFKHCLCMFMLLFAVPPAHAEGLPLPRFVSLKSDEANVRTGPGTRYPIQWVYRRAGMPVEVVEEYDLWRKIRDVEGTTGWVHKTMLDGRRTVMIKGKEARVMRLEPEAKAKPILKAEPMVIARVVECQKDWCRIQLSARKGWIEKKHLWGVYPDEIFE